MGGRFQYGTCPHERPLLATMTHWTFGPPQGRCGSPCLQAVWASGAAGCGYCRLYLDLKAGILGVPPILLSDFAGVECKAEIINARTGITFRPCQGIMTRL